MASSGKKRKREFQDENICAAQNFQSLQNKSDAKKRKVSIQSKQSARKLFEDGSLTNQITKELHSSKRFMVLRSSTKDLTSASTPTTTAATSSSKLSTTGTFQRRASLVKLKKPLTTITGTLKTKLAEQVKKSKMKGQQDYSQPISAVDSSLDHLRFMSALQKQLHPGHTSEQSIENILIHVSHYRVNILNEQD
ncbi:hypothetical protein LSH36_75g07008 [Paralvinella palmiformis]|uniref:Uncharacterized protein n=1 Tax=Paralvinella palmiformis TaxID=53620 RepID=A0AAD9NB17_9ANNE|nr:hypothetical protein LSH36_75g07008 [Paralvinella palmiformis]